MAVPHGAEAVRHAGLVRAHNRIRFFLHLFSDSSDLAAERFEQPGSAVVHLPAPDL